VLTCQQPSVIRQTAGVVTDHRGQTQTAEQLDRIELVECGALIARPGATHQAVHADYRRNNVLITKHAEGGRADEARPSSANGAPERPPMPPRIVVFVYLQDVTSYAHGPTVFLPGTANAAAHEKVLDGSGAVRAGSLEDRPPEWMATARAGDAVVYDASVLHFGAANRVKGNERAVFYFGVSRDGHAAQCAGPAVEGWEAADPVRLWDYL
jgi:ectoine hydroxylase-related dioxygenase (phytanoyl-CoA dioxygenase family)